MRGQKTIMRLNLFLQVRVIAPFFRQTRMYRIDTKHKQTQKSVGLNLAMKVQLGFSVKYLTTVLIREHIIA